MENGGISGGGTDIDYDSTCSITCDTGYELTSDGATSGQCLDSGSVDIPTPACQSKCDCLFL